MDGSGVPPGPALVVEMLVVDGRDPLAATATSRPSRPSAWRTRWLARLARRRIRLAPPGAVTAAEAESGYARAARDAASRARAPAGAAAREADERTRREGARRVLAAVHFTVKLRPASARRHVAPHREYSARVQASAPSTRREGLSPTNTTRGAGTDEEEPQRVRRYP